MLARCATMKTTESLAAELIVTLSMVSSSLLQVMPLYLIILMPRGCKRLRSRFGLRAGWSAQSAMDQPSSPVSSIRLQGSQLFMVRRLLVSGPKAKK